MLLWYIVIHEEIVHRIILFSGFHFPHWFCIFLLLLGIYYAVEMMLNSKINACGISSGIAFSSTWYFILMSRFSTIAKSLFTSPFCCCFIRNRRLKKISISRDCLSYLTHYEVLFNSIILIWDSQNLKWECKVACDKLL